MARSAGALRSFIVTAIAVAGLTPPADADPPATPAWPVSTSMQVPFEGTAAGACQGDLVPVTGELLVVTRVRSTGKATTVDSYFQLNNVKGVGSVSGLRYLGVGTAQLSREMGPELPKSLDYRMNFVLWGIGRPANACIGDPSQVQPLPANVTIRFNTDGSLAGVEAAGRSVGR